MKILELTNFSSGVCGVWQRAKQEAVSLKNKGYEVKVFSSDFIKSSKGKAKAIDNIEGISIQRFPAIHLGGEGFVYWSFEKEAYKFQPDIIIAHNYRSIHSLKAQKIAKKIKCKVFLVTHAPFVKGNITRSFPAKCATIFYDRFIGPKTINKFFKIITVSKWELPYLKKLKADKNKIIYIPNGIPKEFFTQKKSKEEHKLLFLGRIAPIKDIKTLINSLYLIKDKKIKLEIVGTYEETYLKELKELITKKTLQKRVIFSPAIYDLSEKIKKIDSSKILVLPSIREAFGIVIAEAMAREKIVISSETDGAKEMIKPNINGYLFKIKDPKDLAEKINKALENNNKTIKEEAKKTARNFLWDDSIKKLEKLFY